MTTRTHALTKVDELLKESLKNLNIEKTFQVYPIWKNWQSLVGEMISSKAQPEFLRGKTLFISVVNSVWMNEMELQKKSLLKKITQFIPDLTIEEIRFRIKKD